jgi:hypothetical protein
MSPADKKLRNEAEENVKIHHQATTDEDTTGSEDLIRTVVNFVVCELAIVP